jgi:hypothetical protein
MMLSRLDEASARYLRRTRTVLEPLASAAR